MKHKIATNQNKPKNSFPTQHSIQWGRNHKVGLARLKETMKTHKDALSTHLLNREHISEEDEHWLDNEANFVDEDGVVDLLDKASDYECHQMHLDTSNSL